MINLKFYIAVFKGQDCSSNRHKNGLLNMKSHAWTLMYCIAFLLISVTADSYVIAGLKDAHAEKFPNLNWSRNLASQAEKVLDENDCFCNIKDLRTEFLPKKIYPVYYERKNFIVRFIAHEFVLKIERRENMFKKKNRFGCAEPCDDKGTMAILCLYEK